MLARISTYDIEKNACLVRYVDPRDGESDAEFAENISHLHYKRSIASVLNDEEERVMRKRIQYESTRLFRCGLLTSIEIPIDDEETAK